MVTEREEMARMITIKKSPSVWNNAGVVMFITSNAISPENRPI